MLSMYRPVPVVFKLVFLFSSASLLCACTTLPFVPENKAYTRTIETDFGTAWTATIEAVAQGRDVISNSNREQGIIETKWIDNTEWKSFYDVFKDEEFFLRARYRLHVQLREGRQFGKKAVLVRIQKEQQLENNFLGGWETVQSDGVQEATYLYRVGRLIALQEYADKQDEERAKNLNSPF